MSEERVERLRLFVAVDVAEDVLAAVDEAIAPYRDRIPGARWTPPANRHLTIKFLGSVDPTRRDEIASVCEHVASEIPRREISITDLGAFPSARRARVLWAGVDDPDGTLALLALSLDEGLAPLGFEVERRAYKPHLTLARLKSPADVRDVVEAVEHSSDPFVVDRFHLYRSRLSPKGARYDVLQSFRLRGRLT